MKNKFSSENLFGSTFRLVALSALVLAVILSLNLFNQLKKEITVSILNVWAVIVLSILFSSMGVILIAKDILLTQSKEIRETNKELKNLAKSLRKKVKGKTKELSTIIENFTDGLIMTDSYHRIRLINPSAERILNINKKDFIGKNIDSISKESILSEVFYLFKKFTSPIPKTKYLTIKKPKEKVLEVTNIDIYHPSDKYIGNLKIIHDVTREKFIEKLKSEFISIAAHQLRTPLSTIKWTFRMFLDGELGKLSPEQIKFLKNSYKANEQMIALVDDLLNVSKIEEGKFLAKFSPQSIEDLIEEVIQERKVVLDKKNITFKFIKPEDRLPKIKVDAEKLKLAISNILDNAIKYTPSNGKISICISKKDGWIKVEVGDNGIGIPKKEKSRIFEKFFRGKKAALKDPYGTGLGLFITKNIIEAHRGKIYFKSKEGEGSTFWFELPIS